MANTKSYDHGFKLATEESKQILVNGIDEFASLDSFIGFLIQIIGTPHDPHIKDYLNGIVDAATQEWKTVAESEIAELADIRKELDAEIKHRKVG